MTNGRVQTKTDKEQVVVTPRKSRIHKGIERTVQTRDYESVVIRDFIDEEIEWTTLEERTRKVENWETLLIQRFQTFYDKAMVELGLEHKVAFLHKRGKDYSPGPGDRSELDNLDDLDSLGG